MGSKASGPVEVLNVLGAGDFMVPGFRILIWL